jgi:glucosamine-6-phosphate deaminase
MTGFYRCVRDLCQSGDLDLSAIRVVASEEYAGIAAEHPISLFGWLRRELLEPCRIPPDRVLRLVGDAPDLDEECRRFDGVLIEWGGIDLVVQSVGVNGHFGFNEPGSQRDSLSRVVRLVASTRERNAAYWPTGTPIPEHGLTMGVAPTLEARRILLVASGYTKAAAIAQAWTGPITELIPCSLLRLASDVTAVIDRDAARDLPGAYRKRR